VAVSVSRSESSGEKCVATVSFLKRVVFGS
jgi:hypothetical protein